MVVWLCISKICKLKCFPIIGTWNEMISFSPGENRLEAVVVVSIVCNLMLIMMSVGLDFQFSLSALQVEVKYVTITR